ncbi:MAG: HU family DNA-binding protein [Bacteroidaceae bacterium]|nr:HU family DNA-binding protein [Bacteroidaceae bacterium]MBP9637881.1 HU family DNA-binding protein [Bacteroidaceae bacterium]
MNHKEFLSKLTTEGGYTSSYSQKKLSLLVNAITEQLQEGNTVAISGFGTFEVKKKNERISVNPVTKNRLLIPPKLVVNFKPSASIKEKYKEDK